MFRTALSLLWRDFTADPANLTGLAFRGLLLGLILLVGFLVCLILFSGPFGFVAALWIMAKGPQNLAVIPEGVNAWTGKLIGWSVVIAFQFQVVRWISRRAPDRELAACLALIILEEIIGIPIGIGVALAQGESVQLTDQILGLTVYQVPYLIPNLPLFAGAVWVRRHAVGRAVR